MRWEGSAVTDEKGVSMKTQAIAKRVSIPVPTEEVEWRIIYLRIRGVTPLLMHNPKDLMALGNGRKASRKQTLPPEVEARLGAYRTPDGYLYVGADHFREALLRGSSGLRVGRKPLRPYLAAALFILEPYFVLERNGAPLTEYDRIDIRRAVVKKQGIQRARPVIDLPWEFTARYQYDPRVILDPENFVESAQEAGLRIGLLDYRPECGGIFGRFEVVESWWEVL